MGQICSAINSSGFWKFFLRAFYPEKGKRKARHNSARPRASGKKSFSRETTGRMVWHAQRFKLKMPWWIKAKESDSSLCVGGILKVIFYEK